MGPGHCDGGVIIFHELPEQFGAGQHWDLSCNSLDQLRIAPVDRRGIDNAADAGSDILRALSIGDMSALGFQFLCQR